MIKREEELGEIGETLEDSSGEGGYQQHTIYPLFKVSQGNS